MFHSFGDIIDWFLFIPCAIAIGYMLVFAIASLKRNETLSGSKTRKLTRFLILTTAGPDDKQVEKTVKSVLAQEYDDKSFDMVLVGDNLPSMLNMKLMQYPITFIRTQMESGNKLKALQYAMQHISPLKIYDMVILIDPDETIGTQFLQKVNRSYQFGYRMMQAHRTDIDRDSNMMILATTFEEINNSIFRIGHNSLGLSSALVGSGLCAEYNWFKDNIVKLSSQFEEKEMEILILKQQIYIDYLDDAIVYVDHSAGASHFNSQRRKWMLGQLNSLGKNVKYFIPALFKGNFDLADKILQWMLPPRTVLVSIISTMSIVMPFFSWNDSFKWWLSLFVFAFACAIAIPDYLVDSRWEKSFLKSPILLLGTMLWPFYIIWNAIKYPFTKKKA